MPILCQCTELEYVQLFDLVLILMTLNRSIILCFLILLSQHLFIAYQ